MIPALPGLEVVRRLRSAGQHTPVLVLTARDEKEWVVSASQYHRHRAQHRRVECGLGSAAGEQRNRHRRLPSDERLRGGRCRQCGCTIQVFFTPTALGTRSGTMMIFDNTVAGSHSVSMSSVLVAVQPGCTPEALLLSGHRETATGLAFPAKASRLPRRRRDYPV